MSGRRRRKQAPAKASQSEQVQDVGACRPGYYRVFIDDVGWRTLNLPIPAEQSQSWRYQLEVDADDWWWLVRDGRRSSRRKWRPADPWEALVAADVLYMLNDLGPVPITGEFREAAEKVGIPLEDLRWDVRKQAASLWLRKLIGSAYVGKS